MPESFLEFSNCLLNVTIRVLNFRKSRSRERDSPSKTFALDFKSVRNSKSECLFFSISGLLVLSFKIVTNQFF